MEIVRPRRTLLEMAKAFAELAVNGRIKIAAELKEGVFDDEVADVQNWRRDGIWSRRDAGRILYSADVWPAKIDDHVDDKRCTTTRMQLMRIRALK